MSDNVKIGAEVELNPSSTANIKTLKQQLRDAIKEAQVLSQQDLGSAGAIAAQKRVAQLKDQIEDTNDAIKSFTGAGQFQAFGKAVQGIAGGFAAAQGAMALMGSESEDLQKILIKVNGAMALSQGLAALEDAPRAFMQIRTMIVSQVIPALGTLRGALIATGIGAAAVAVGLLVSNWEKVVKVVREFIGLGPSQEQIIKDQTEAIEKQNKAIEKNQQLQDLAIRSLRGRDKESAELAKKQTDETLALREKIIKELIKEDEARRLYASLAAAHEQESLELREKFRQEDADKAEKDRQKRLEKQKKDDEKLTELMYKQIDMQRWANEELLKMEEELSLSQAQIDGRKAENEYHEYLKGKKRQEEAKKHKLELDLQKIESERQLANESFQIMQNLNTLAGENFEVQKGISIAQTGVDTYEAAQSTFKAASKSPITTAFPAYPFIAAGLAITAGLARIRQMQQMRPSNRSISSGGSGGFGGTPAPPSFNPAQGTNVQGAGNINLNTQPTSTRVYVLETDIRNTQKRVDTIQSNASLK